MLLGLLVCLSYSQLLCLNSKWCVDLTWFRDAWVRAKLLHAPLPVSSVARAEYLHQIYFVTE